MRKKSWLKIIFLTFTAAVVFTAVFIFLCYFGISKYSQKYIYSDIEKLPTSEVALVLGTNKKLKNGRNNPFYQERIRAAANLYQHKKVKYFILSGANPSIYYNEPADMRRDLIAAGVPAERIQTDYAGRRTLDSILRAKEVFQVDKYLIISQKFHNERAIFLARSHSHQAIAFNAKDSVRKSRSKKLRIREVGARVKAVLDVIFGKKAEIYGEKIPFPPHEKP